MGLNGPVMSSLLVRAAGRKLAALICMGMCMGLGACDISSSATDRKARLAELEQIEQDNRKSAEYDEEDRRVWQRFTSRYQGRVEPGVGCDVCPELCKEVDLRAMSADAFQQAYREASAGMLEVLDRMASRVAFWEHERLRCIVRGQPGMRDAFLGLLESKETPRVRYDTAVDAFEMGFDYSEFRQALYEVGQGTSTDALSARMLLDRLDREKHFGQ